MLPLDKLTAEAEAGFIKHGIDTAALDYAVCLDLDLNGNFGETWLAVDYDKKLLYRMAISSDSSNRKAIMSAVDPHDPSKKTSDKKEKVLGIFNEAYFDALPFSEVRHLYVDNFFSSNRILAKKDVTDDEDEESGNTYIIAYCTNTPKKKMFAFIELLKKNEEGIEVTEDDSLFDQFNAKCPKCGQVYPDQNRRICDNCNKRGATVKRLISYFADYKLEIAIIFFCMLASSGVGLLSPIISGKLLIDQVIDVNGKFHTSAWVYIVCGVVFGISLLSVLIGILQSRINIKISTRVTLKMKLDIFTAMQRLSLSFFNNNQTGRLINRVNSDADTVKNFFINDIPHAVINIANLIGLTIFLMSMNWKLTLIVFVPVPFIVFIFKFKLPKLWNMYSKQWRSNSSLNSTLNDSLTGVRVVKAFAKETDETNRFYKSSERVYKTNLEANLLSLTIWPLISLLIGLSSQAIWGFGGYEVIQGNMTYGEFTAYFGYLGMIFGPISFFTNLTNTITATANAAQRMFEVLDAVPEVAEAPDAVTIERIKGDIEFNNVCFHYNPNRPILKNVNIKINAGDHIGLVGHTGAGKSTIANLINRLYDVVSGDISIDGVNVKKIASHSLRTNIAIVSQEIFLFKGTIADNIRYARPDASMEEVIAAARVANAHDFIIRLPDGYETVVGTGSRSLSGGERQRVSIARALLLDPSILILDEATAAMDTETERLIQDALSRLVQGKTTITIAHRLSTLKDCNYLYAIENGEIAEEGSHDDLIEKRGVYYRLWSLQTEAMKRVLQGM